MLDLDGFDAAGDVLGLRTGDLRAATGSSATASAAGSSTAGRSTARRPAAIRAAAAGTATRCAAAGSAPGSTGATSAAAARPAAPRARIPDAAWKADPKGPASRSAGLDVLRFRLLHRIVAGARVAHPASVEVGRRLRAGRGLEHGHRDQREPDRNAGRPSFHRCGILVSLHRFTASKFEESKFEARA